MITHDPRIAAATDEAWLIEAGRLVATGPPARMLARRLGPPPGAA